jgi:hypothetical protein
VNRNKAAGLKVTAWKRNNGGGSEVGIGSASPRLCACPTLLREQGVRNGFGFILVQAVEFLQTG